MTVCHATFHDLAGQSVFITGGGSGIGAALTEGFLEQGARVAFVQRSDASAFVEEMAARHGRSPLFVPCDITDVPALQAAVARASAENGPVTILVNNAANDARHALEDLDSDGWDRNQAINLKPHFFSAQAAIPGMKAAGGGSIINFSSIAWRLGSDTMAPYATAKSAVIGLTKALARGFGADNIRVNAIEPGAVMTEKQRQLWYKTAESVDAMVERQLLRRVLTGEDIARAVLFLASDDSRMITKQSLIVDAGMA